MESHVKEPAIVVEPVSIGKRRLVYWILDHKNLVIFVSLIVFSLVFTLFTLFSRASSPVLENGDKIFESWKADRTLSEESFQKVQEALKKYPPLRTKLEAPIAQHLLQCSRGALAKTYAEASLNRCLLSSSYYREFAKNSLLISQGSFQEALENAKTLKRNMDQNALFLRAFEKKWGGILYALNLLRIASLEKECGSAQGELSAWQEFKEKMDHPAFALVQGEMRIQDLTLLDFANYRISAISSNKS